MLMEGVAILMVGMARLMVGVGMAIWKGNTQILVIVDKCYQHPNNHPCEIQGQSPKIIYT
jgi:hypothetical protein